MIHKTVLLLLTFFIVTGAITALAESNVLFRINFDSLTDWEPSPFPKIKAHSKYTLVSEGTSRSSRLKAGLPLRLLFIAAL